jgi:ABC-type Fe3+ transport system substrate-binding protein
MDERLDKRQRRRVRGVPAIVFTLAAVLAACTSTPAATPGATPGGTAAGPTATPDLATATTVAQVLAAVDGLSAEAREKALVAKAEQEGKFVGYFATSVQNGDAMAKAFKDAYPKLTVEHLAFEGPDMIERIITEGTAGRHTWDVAYVNVEHLKPMRDNNLLTAYRGPAVADFPEDSVDPDGLWVDAMVIYQATMYNKNLVSRPPATLADLADPRFSRAMIIHRQEYEWYQAVIETLGEEKARPILEGIAANRPRTSNAGGEMRELTASGEVAMTITAGDHLIFPQIKSGAPVEMVYLKEMNIKKHGPLVISNNTSHPAAAVLFYDWALTKGQTVFAGLGRNPGNPSVPIKDAELQARRQGAVFVSVNPNEFAEKFDSIVESFNKLFVPQ